MRTPTLRPSLQPPRLKQLARGRYTPRARLAALAVALGMTIPTGCGPGGGETLAPGHASAPVPVAGSGIHPPAPAAAGQVGQAPTRQAAPPAPSAAAQPAPLAPLASAIAVEGAWARAAAATKDAAGVPNANSAVYMIIRNGSSRVDTLIGATSDAAEMVEVHRTSMDGGVMRMRPAGDVDVPASGQVTLEPGGLHVMLIGLRQDLSEGASVSVTLRFAQAGEVHVIAPVRRQAMPGM